MPLAYFANKKMFDEIRVRLRVVWGEMTIYVDDLTFLARCCRRALSGDLKQ